MQRVNTVFGNLLSAETSDELQELAREIMPLMSEHENNISLNEKLFARIKAVYELTDKNKLTPEQSKLLEDIYTGLSATEQTCKEMPKKSTAAYAKS